MYHLDKHDRAVLGLALDTAMLSLVNAIEDTPITDMALEGYIYMLTEFKRINEKLYTFLTALEDSENGMATNNSNRAAGNERRNKHGVSRTGKKK